MERAGGGLAQVAEKLVHPLQEVRRRSLQSLDFKTKQGLLAQNDFLQDRSILKHLLGLLQFDDNGVQVDAAALLLLQRLCSTFPAVGRQLLQQGAEDTMRSIRTRRSEDVQQLIDATLASITSAPMDGGTRMLALPPPTASGRMAQQQQQPIARPLEMEFTSVIAHRTPSGTAHTLAPPLPATAAATFTWTPSKQVQGWAGRVAPTPSGMSGHHTGVMDTVLPRGPGARTRETPARHVEATPAPLAALAPAAAPGTAAAPSYLSGDAQALVSRMRAERSGAAQPQGVVANLATVVGVPADASDWLLAPVTLSPTDEQLLFDLAGRLKYLEDPGCIVAPALLELLTVHAVDFPSEALITRAGLLDQLLIIICVPGACEDATAQDLATALLLKLMRGLKHSLGLSTDPMTAPCNSGAPPTTVQLMSARGVRGLAVSPNTSPTKTAPSADARAGADSQPPSYPLALPEPPESAQQGAALQQWIEERSVLNVSALAYIIALQLLPVLRLPGRHFQLLPLLEELLPLLLVGRSGTGPQAGSEGLRTKWSALLGALSGALLANLAIARSEAPAMVQAFHDEDAAVVPLLLNLPSAALLVLATRMLRALPRDMWVSEVVPAAIADALAAAARDDLLSAALPEGWRDVVTPVLARLRPDVAQVLSAAKDGEHATLAAQRLVAELPHLLSGTAAPALWLETLAQALVALDLSLDPELLQAMVQGVAFVCSACSMEGAGVQAQAEAALLGLMSHALPAVHMAAYSLLERLVMEARGVADSPLVGLVLRPGVLQHLMAPGLADTRVRTSVARMLQELLQRGEPETNACLLSWGPWVRCYADDPQAGVLAASLDTVSRSVASQLPDAEWGKTWLALLGLLDKKQEARQEASRVLRDVLYSTMGLHVPGAEPYTADPFKAVLDDGARDDLILPGTGSVGAAAGSGAGARLARSFKVQDADNLITIMGNTALAPELRRSAAEQLLTLAAEPRLLTHIAQPQHLAIVLAALVPPGLLGTEDGAATTTSAVLLDLDMALHVAAANLLYALCCGSRDARTWVSSEAGGRSQLRAALPLVYHQLLTVRRAMGRLLAAVVVQSEADQWRGWGAAVAAASANGAAGHDLGLRLPTPFAAAFSLPCKAVWVEVAVSLGGHELVGLADKPQLRGLVAQQRAHVALLVEQRRLLRAAGGSLLAALQQLNERPGSWRLPAPAAHACVVNMMALSLGDRVAAALSAVTDAGSHAECSDALRTLQLLASTRQGIAALVTCDWPGAFDRLLTNSPANADDRALWLELLPLVERMAHSGLLSRSQMLHLALCCQQSITAVLAEPHAAAGLTLIPVALAGSAALDSQSDATRPGGLQILQTTHAALRVLVALLQCVASRASVGHALRVTHALGLPALLKLLVRAYIESPPGTHYGARALAVGVVQGVLGLLRAGSLLPSSEAAPSLDGVQQLLIAAHVGLLTHVCNGDKVGGSSVSSGGGSQGGAAPHTSAVGAATAAAAAAGSFRGKGLLRAAMQCQVHLLRLLPVHAWSGAWEQASGVFWVSRGSRDREASVRAASLTLLGLLLSPSAHATQRMVASGWPDAPGSIIRAVMDPEASYGVRAAALRVLCCLLALPPSLHGADHADLTVAGRALVPMTPEALLQQAHLWDALPGMLRDKDAPPGYVAAALAALLQGLCVDVETFSAHLALPGTLAWLVASLSGDGQSKLLHAAAGGAAAIHAAALTSTGVCAGFGTGDGDAGTPPLHLWPADPYSNVVAPTPVSSCGLDMRVVTTTGAPPSGPAADDGASLAAGASGEGLRIPEPPRASSSAAEYGLAPGEAARIMLLRPGAVAEARSVAALAAQILGLALMESEHVDLAAAGQPSAHLLTGLLVVLLQLGAGIGAADRALPEQPPEGAAATARLLDIVHHVAVAASNLAQLTGPKDLAGVVARVGSVAPPSSHPALLVGLVELMSARCMPAHTQLPLACLLATLLAPASLAYSLLHVRTGLELASTTAGGAGVGEDGQEGGEEEAAVEALTKGPEHVCPSSGQAVGGQLCVTLTALIPPEALTIPKDPEGRPIADIQVLEGEALVFIVALRNVLAHSAEAKLAALRTGLHTALLHTCVVATQALEAAVVRPGAAGATASAASSRAPSAAPSRRTTAPNTPAATGRLSGGGDAPPPPPQPWERPAPLAVPQSTSRSVVAPAAAGAAGKDAAAAVPLLRYPALEKKVTVALSLLKHLAHRSVHTRGVLLQEGALRVLRSLWRHGFGGFGGRAGGSGSAPGPGPSSSHGSGSGAAAFTFSGEAKQHVTASAALHEALGFMTNMLPSCASARSALAEEGSPTLLQSVLVLMFEHKLESSTWGLVTSLVGHLAATEDGCSALLRGRTTGAAGIRGTAGLTSSDAATSSTGSSAMGFLAPAYRLLQDLVGSCTGTGRGRGTSSRPGAGQLKEVLARTLALMQVLVSVAAQVEGAKALLKSGACPGLLELLLGDVLELDGCSGDGNRPLGTSSSSNAPGGQRPHASPAAPQALVASCLLLLRNLCFSPEAKAHLLAHPNTLPVLVAHAERAGEAPHAATHAASAIWALIYQGEKVKSALRRVPSALQRLEVARASAEFQASRLSKGLPAPAATDKGAAAAAAAAQQLAWLQQASDTIGSVLAVMSATSQPQQPQLPGVEGAGGVKVLGWPSPARGSAANAAEWQVTKASEHVAGGVVGGSVVGGGWWRPGS